MSSPGSAMSSPLTSMATQRKRATVRIRAECGTKHPLSCGFVRKPWTTLIDLALGARG